MQTSLRPTASRQSLIINVALVLVLWLTACQPIQRPATDSSADTGNTSAMAELLQITITATDYAFALPAELPAGLVDLTLQNAGKVNHHGIVMRLLEGVTQDQLQTVLQAPEGDFASVSDLSFFLPDTGPGLSNQATVELQPGQWVILSVAMGDFADPRPDWMKGSLASFTVTANTTEVSAPAADLVVTIGNADADMPADLSAGQHTIQVVNGSDKADGWAFFIRLEGDTTVEEILAMFDALFAGQQPEKMAEFTPVGGLMGYNLSKSFYTTVDFTPGNYAVITSINAQGFPYTGLSKIFTVAAVK